MRRVALHPPGIIYPNNEPATGDADHRTVVSQRGSSRRALRSRMNPFLRTKQLRQERYGCVNATSFRGREDRSARIWQAAVEFAVVVTLMLVLLLAIIDFGRALNYMQVMVGLTRQGSNLASRGTSLAGSAAAVVAGSAPLSWNRQYLRPRLPTCSASFRPSQRRSFSAYRNR
jgi:hypothetical protein